MSDGKRPVIGGDGICDIDQRYRGKLLADGLESISISVKGSVRNKTSASRLAAAMSMNFAPNPAF